MEQDGARHLFIFGVDNLQGTVEACPDVESSKNLHDSPLIPTCAIELRKLHIFSVDKAGSGSGIDVVSPSYDASREVSNYRYDTLYREEAELHEINTLGPLFPGSYELGLEGCFDKSDEIVHSLVVNPEKFQFNLRDDASVVATEGGADEFPPGISAVNFSFTVSHNDKVPAHQSGAHSPFAKISTAQLKLMLTSQILSTAATSSAVPFLAAGASLVMIVLSVFALAVCAVVCIRQIEDMPSRRRRARLDVRARALESRGSKPSSQPGTPRASEMKELMTKFETVHNEDDDSTQEKNPNLGDFW